MKKIKQPILILTLILTLAACSNPTSTLSPSEIAATDSLPTPQVYITPAPDVDTMLSSYFSAWQVDDYAAMYVYLSKASQGTISEEDFIQKYNDTGECADFAICHRH